LVFPRPGADYVAPGKNSFRPKGICICHLLGEINVGKSALRHQLEATFPRQKTTSGFMIKEEETLSVHKLFEKITEERPVIVQDPPASDIDKINIFLDLYFENKVEMTNATKKSLQGDQPRCGALFVWPNENRKLSKLTATAITKGIFLILNRNDFTFEKFAELEKSWSDKKDTAPAIFLSFLRNPDLDALEVEMDRVVQIYQQNLSEKYSKAFLNENQRLLKQYALVEAALLQWLQNNRWEIELHDNLHKYVLEACIPYMFEILESRKRGGNAEVHVSAAEQLSEKIRELSDVEFLSEIAILYENQETHFGFSLPLANFNNLVKAFISSIGYISKGRKSVLHAQSKKIWFHRTSKGCLYGTERRIKCMFVLLLFFPSISGKY
jgi:hypothetical protein